MSTLRLRLSARARREIFSAVDWWAHHRTAAPNLLSEEIERAFQTIINQPGIGTPVISAHGTNIRRYLIGRTGYWLY